ncbi:DUF4153 domain-containing protein [Chryseobacterium oranimense]|uniref:DUF4153 domain-containing protein n=1 Tax=Chryseobacterium oranimense TaxID=421058 RepID=UPI0021AFA64A|nr:DUF4153 domain-containing protein [Chryseobacterium oranimense]UWX62036.1 DUF4153 domain-containing protein [Chryseobacterium oranimense]
MKTKFREIAGKAQEVLLRYPMVLLMGLLSSIGAICMLDSKNNNELLFTHTKFTICCCLGISLMFALKILSQRIGKRLLLEVLGTAFLIGFYFVLPGKKRDFTEVYGFIVAITFLLSHLLVSFAAFLEKNRELNFWQYNKNLFVNIFLTAVFTGVLTGGVELAILAVDKLFDFNFNDLLYADTFYVLAIFGSCFIFLLFNETGLNYLEKDGTYPVILKFFTQFVLIPLLFIYAIILYFYSFKIIINWELPRGWVSYLVLAYSIVGILALLLVYPLKEEKAKSWVKVFSKLFYYTIIPLLVLLFTAIFTRILEYGYTEPRYFVLLLALWLLSVVVYFILNKKASIKFTPVSLFIFGIFSLIFPYLNAFSVAKRSQKNELITLLDQNKLLVNHKIDFQKRVSDTLVEEISNKFQFLAERKQKDFLLNLVSGKTHNLLARDFERPYSWAFVTLKDAFTNVDKTQEASAFERLVLESETRVTNIQGYQYLINFNNYNQESRDINGDTFEIDNQTEVNNNRTIRVILNSTEAVDFGPAMNKLFESNTSKTGTVTMKEIAMESDLGKYHIKIVFQNISRDKTPDSNKRNIFYDNAVLLIKEK